MPEASRQRRRVFFALWPDQAALERLDQVGRQLHALGGRRRMRRETLHLTLAFIGELPGDRIEILLAAARQVAAPAFSLCLDRLDCWRHKRIAWIGCSQPPLALLTLVGQLYERLAAAGLPLETAEFAAHMTLLRNIHCARCAPMPALEAIGWSVTDFVLVESRLASEGPHYTVIGRWPLVGETSGAGRDGDDSAAGCCVPQVSPGST
ncbi:MAG: RNA 2',3'-cyclic phosphodiesterase [Sterolibacterium sp.]|jgi:2'-5' RNA ligase